VLLHVGAPKTGTSFVQDMLFQHRSQLAAQGVLYPADRFDAQFLAALDLMELRWGGLEREAVGAWERLAAQVRDWDGAAIVSHEILAAASAEQVRRAVSSLGPGAELHVVMSVRDLVRQLPAEWQENVKHRRTLGYHDFLRRVTADEPAGSVPTWFWAVQDVPAVLARWGAGLPPDRVHVVTVPRPGAAGTTLWERFARVFGLDPSAYDLSVVERANPSLGVAEGALLRLVNQRVNGVVANEHYREFVRELLAHRTLARPEGAERIRLPHDVQEWAAERSERWATTLAERGYDVVGSLDDLLADPPLPVVGGDPDRVAPESLVEPALASISALVLRAGELREEVDGLAARLAEVEAERDHARREVGAWLRFKRSVVRRSGESPVLARGLTAYRRLRRR
jgi:hypothetical protein